MDYDIRKLKERFRAIGILKNRHGEVNKRVGLLYLGEMGHFEELPLHNMMSPLHYTKIQNLSNSMYLTQAQLLDGIKKKKPQLYTHIVDKIFEGKIPED